MNIRRVILTWIALTGCLVASAQKISFDKHTITTSKTLWKQPVTAVFKFTNKSKTPLAVTYVDPGCGCLTSYWTKGYIERGETGEISITYDAMQLGRFDRIIEVFTNASEKPERIRMKGIVTSGPRKTFEDLYPFSIDNIHLSTNSVEFAEVHKNDSAKAVIDIYNGGQEVYSPILMHLPPYITAKAEPEMVARGRKGKIELTLHGDKLNDYGLNQTNIYLARYAGDKVGTDNDINVSAILLPDLTSQNQAALHPSFNISTTNLNLGKIGNKKKLTGKVKITNRGAGVLSIDRLQAFNPAIMVNLQKSEIQPNESVYMAVTVQSKYLEMSKAQPRVLIITNDPQHPKEVVTVLFE